MYVLAFDSTHAALAAQKILASLGPAVIPTPRAITVDCGMALKFDDEDAALKAGALLAEHSEVQRLSSWHVLD